MSRRPLILFVILFSGAVLTAKAQAPVADFSASTVAGCGPLVVNFKDLSSNKPVYWAWDFGNGQISNQPNPSVQYATPGVYTVTLIVKNTSGTNSARKPNYITVYPYPAPNFNADRTLACAPANINFSDLSTPGQGAITQWLWTFGDGNTSPQPNPAHSYAQPGYYTVSLQVTNTQGCTAAAGRGRYVRVVAGVKADFAWSQTTNSCTAPFQLKFNNQTSGPGNLNYAWDFGNGTTSGQANPAVTFTSNKTDTVTLTAQSDLGCSQTTKKYISFPGVGSLIKSPDTGCVNAPVNFLNGSSPGPVSSSWSFGDGNSSGLASPANTYGTPGTYTVKLVNTYATCVDSATKPISILNNPVPNFTSAKTASCKPPFTAGFQDLTPGATGWQWDFGDGSPISTQPNPTHTYTTAGSFDVKLTVTNRNGCSGTLTKRKFIQIVPPTATISNAPAQGCTGGAGFTFSPIASVNTVDGVPTYSWIASGATPSSSTSPTPSFTYTVQGDYDISLTITTPGGCPFTTTFKNAVVVGDPVTPVFTVSLTDACAHAPVTFISTTSPADHWYWEFGDGPLVQGRNTMQHSYNDTGNFQIYLSTTNHGCTQRSPAATLIHINPPIAKFGYITYCDNKYLVSFSDSSVVDPAKGAATYQWNFGDGTIPPALITVPVPASHLPPISHTYSTLKSYTVTLIVSNGSCMDTIKKTITLTSQFADFSLAAPTACKNAPFKLTATRSDPAVITSYQWQVGAPPAPYTAGNRSYTTSLPDTGTYPLSLIITDINGCKDTSSVLYPHSIKITGPMAKFIPALPAGGCRNSPILFTDQSTTDGTSALVGWTWNFGDGITQPLTGPSFTHSYADTGLYTVKLTVKDANGCTDTYSSATAVLITAPLARFAASDTFYCPNALLQFTDSSKGHNLSSFWDFGDGGTSTLTNPQHPFPTSGTRYSVKLRVTDQVGCTDSLTRTNYIFIQHPIAAFSIKDSTTVCPPLETSFIPNPQYYDSLYWNFGDGTTSTLPNTTHFYNGYDTFYAKLILRGPGGCLDSATRRIFVLDPYATTALNYGPLQACDSITADFTITVPGFTRFTLYFGDQQADSSQTTSLSHSYRSPATYVPQLLLQDSTGCIVGITKPLNILVLGATPYFGMDKNKYCDSGLVNFTDFTVTNDPIISKIWDFKDGNTSIQNDPNNFFDPNNYYKAPGTYLPVLKVNTQNNCVENYTDTVRIYQTPHPVFTPTPPFCAGAPLQFQGGLVTPEIDTVSWHWNFGNGQTSTQQNPTVTYASAGQYTVHLQTSVSFGCSDTTSADIRISALPSIKAPPEVTTPVGIPITLPIIYGSGITNYSWTPANNLSCTDCPNPVANPIFTTIYKVTVTNSDNCVSSALITVRTVCNGQNYFIPNTFSPNGDGVNDIFYPRGNNVNNIQSMRIFNRWGQLVFEKRSFPANSPGNGWDGRFNGGPAPADAYVYIIEVICENAQIVALKGDVTLVR